MGLDLELQYETTQQRPIPQLGSVEVTENLSQEVCAAKPLSFGSSGPAAVVVTSAGDLSTVDLCKVSSGQEGAIVATWAAAGEEGAPQSQSLATVRAAHAVVQAQSQSCRSPPGGSIYDFALRVVDTRQSDAAHEQVFKGGRDGVPGPLLSRFPLAFRDLFSPPDCSIPIVLASWENGYVVSIDLRKIGKPADWPVVVAPATGGGGGGGVGALDGDGQTLLVSRKEGALVGSYSFGRGASAGGESGDGGGESKQDKWERIKQERKDKKAAAKERKLAKAMKKQNKDAGRRQTTGRQGGRSKGSR